jgi:hypothetical protein
VACSGTDLGLTILRVSRAYEDLNPSLGLITSLPSVLTASSLCGSDFDSSTRTLSDKLKTFSDISACKSSSQGHAIQDTGSLIRLISYVGISK